MQQVFRKVAVAISGGVDSAVSALMLKQQGFDVHGVFMRNWDITDETGHCSVNADYSDAQEVCHRLQIPLVSVNFVKEYWNEVFLPTVKEYQAGYTPNPDVMCNRNIKFNHLYKHAIHTLGVDAIATGHYINTSFGPYLENYQCDENVRLYMALDELKDQTLFLCQVPNEPLRKTMFPVGKMLKRDVKRVAMQNGLEKFANKKESMGICFIGQRNFQSFIREYVDDKPGEFVDVDTGQVVGVHNGVHMWTVGQRANLSGYSKAYYVVRKNSETNEILVGQGNDHPMLYTSLFFTGKPHWFHSQPTCLASGYILECKFKFQHVHEWTDCSVCDSEEGLVVHLKAPIVALTPGQYALFMKDTEYLGSAKILDYPITNFTLQYIERSKSGHNNGGIKDGDGNELNKRDVAISQ